MPSTTTCHGLTRAAQSKRRSTHQSDSNQGPTSGLLRGIFDAVKAQQVHAEPR